MSDIEWTDEDDEPEWKPCVPVSCSDEELGWVSFTAHPIILDNRHFLLTESPTQEEDRRRRLSTLLGVPEGEQGVRLPPTPPDQACN